MRARTLTRQRNTHPHEIPDLRPPGEGQLRNRAHKFRNRTTKWRRSQQGGLQAARSAVSSAKNELFVPIEDRQFVRNPSLTPPLPWLASLPDP